MHLGYLSLINTFGIHNIIKLEGNSKVKCIMKYSCFLSFHQNMPCISSKAIATISVHATINSHMEYSLLLAFRSISPSPPYFSTSIFSPSTHPVGINLNIISFKIFVTFLPHILHYEGYVLYFNLTFSSVGEPDCTCLPGSIMNIYFQFYIQ